MSEPAFKIGDRTYSSAELIELGATSPDVFYTLFFPRSVRQASPPFLKELDEVLDDPTRPFVLAEMFRGSAKTTRFRLWVARRIAYGLTRTGLFVGPSEGAASRSLRWLRRQVQFNTVYATVFGLELVKWGDTELAIHSRPLNSTSWFLAMGITSNSRGINFDDYRPDLIVLDDVITDENSASKDQRDKVNDMIHGAIRQSLAPKVDNPNAKLAMLQTPLNAEDAAALARKDKQWKTITIPCWTRDTLDEPIEKQVSAWPERVPTKELREEKQAYLDRNELSIFAREKECRLISREKAQFNKEWLQVLDIMPKHSWNLIAIDPLPPPSPREEQQGLKGKDYEAIAVIGHFNGNYYLQDYATNRGHDPGWTVAKVFEFATKYRPFKIVVEGVAYQRTLKWILEEAMKRRGEWYMVEAVNDKMAKFKRIVGTINGVASNRKLFCHSSHVEFIHQFTTYHTPGEPVDLIDAVALGLSRLVNPALELGGDEYQSVIVGGKRYAAPKLRACP